MIKYSSPSDFNFQEDPVSLVEQPSDLVKRAADGMLKLSSSKGQTDIHVIALGGSEGYGFNRNSDGFPEEDCIKKHGTFLEAWGMPDGRGVCRNHKNKKTDPRYGTIKQSSYHRKMRRVELMIGLDNDTCRDEIQKLASGKQISFSMAAKVDADRCSECGHLSKTGAADDRCDCINNHLGEITKTGNYIGMINPDPNWGELSIVGRPADRIAYSIKTASVLHPKVAHLTPEIAHVPDRLKISKKASDKLPVLKKLSDIEKRVAAVGVKKLKDHTIAGEADRPQLSKATIEELRKAEPGHLLKSLADHGIVFSPEEFMQYLFSDKVREQHTAGMKSHLHDIFSETEKKHGGEPANNDRYEPGHHGVKGVEKLKDHSYFDEPSHQRIMRIVIMGNFKPKTASAMDKTASAMDKSLAEQYTAYKLATVNYLDEKGKLTDQFLERVVWQNFLP